ncbi:hypothetical protein Zmor_026100 [Zophobas morio]|uniref:SID1 transmembrane family member 1 n=1 Tax=Zophobas morio TaxID=2755281 RepID=A0AA38M4S1_9CUCU|nr:hypothetical protein Zmor_026100 [Zophobas morio]
MISANISFFMLITTSVFALTTGDLINVIIKEGIFSNRTDVTLNSTTRRLFVFTPQTPSSNPYNVHVWTSDNNVSKDHPVVVMVEQEQDVLEWSIPLTLESSNGKGSVLFNGVSRTLCDSKILSGVNATQNFTVSLSTSSPDNVNVSLQVVEKGDFHLTKNKTRKISIVAPGRPQYFLYKPDFNVDLGIEINIASNKNICFTAVVQKIKCPVYVSGQVLFEDGIRQTVITKGTIRINSANFPHGFILIILKEHAENLCEEACPEVICDEPPEVTIEIKNTIPEEYILITLKVVGCIAGFYFVAILTCCFFSWWEKRQQSAQPTDNNLLHGENHMNEETSRDNENSTNHDTTVASLCRSIERNKIKAHNYWLHVANIAIFYGIPVVQLAVTYQEIVNKTGDEDNCYYNFGCANPGWLLSDFNHVQSNIGYIAMGFLFLGMVLHRRRVVPERKTGIPVYYGTYYAMATALISEGILSGCYHVCPTETNFQFDVSFMYVIIILYLLKLYQNRHSDLAASAYSTFTVLGCIVFIAVIGIIIDEDQPRPLIVVPLVVVYTTLCIYISLKIYYFHNVLTELQQLWMGLRESYQPLREMLQPQKKGRFLIIVISNICNLAFLISGTLLYVNKTLDFGTFLLVLLMGNAVLYSIFYLIMKILIHREGISVQAVIYGVLGVALWVQSMILFLDKNTQMALSPAESRNYNQHCLEWFWNFYDKHDLWHFSSAGAIYFTFMFLLCLDDNIVLKERRHIPVF